MAVSSKKVATVDQNYCVACGCCVTACPLSAIYIKYGIFANIDQDVCVGCGKCKKACPASVIEIEVRK
jgi:heterodisulfide reductase subunit A-like polyferredoxin